MSTGNVYDLIRGVHFDATSASIVSRADRLGARVFEVSAGGKTVRVLAHDAEAAQSAAKDWVEAPACENCGEKSSGSDSEGTPLCEGCASLL